MFSGGFFWLYALMVIQAIFVLVAVVAVFVMLFMTGRRAPDPRAVLIPTAFALSITFAGLMGHIGAWGAIGTALGQQAGGSVQCRQIFGRTVEFKLLSPGAERQGSLAGCNNGAARRVATALPYLLVSGAALGGGSRMFRRLLNEERAHDRA